MTVADLIDTDQGCWNIEAARAVLTEADIDLLLQLPLSKRLPRDELFWWPTKDGSYTVKSGYWLGRRGSVSNANHETDEDTQSLWRMIWRMNIPPKLAHFTWRVCVGILAVQKNLFSRHCCMSPSCNFCEEEECSNHALFQCEWAKRVWEDYGYGDIIEATGELFCRERVEWILTNLEEEGKWRFLAVAWAIWTIRNQRIFEETPPPPELVLTGFVKMVTDYRLYATRVLSFTRNDNGAGGNSWSAPDVGRVKINTDAYLTGSGEVGLGVVARDANGRVLWTGSKRVRAGWDVAIAEAQAAIFGLEVAQARNETSIILESDALNLVNAIRTKLLTRTPLGLGVDDICYLLSSFPSYVVSHVKRGGNTVAHAVARLCETVGSAFVLSADFPQAISALAEIDLI
ncbi:uncharacterized protein LOC141614514 [Silene latifolia]|uniref:uncharacterized protein LOC141614514 n=1 Tax=Silene latifolia TaxID=37657 RepID=UPI003D77DA4F